MFYDRFIELCKKKGVKPSAVAKEIGLSNAAPTYWKNGSVPTSGTIQSIADYFEVTVDYLLGNADHPSIFRPANHTDISVVDIEKPDIIEDIDLAFYGDFNELSEDDQETIRAMVRLMRERREAKKKPPQD